MQEKKEGFINEVDLLKKNQDLLKRVMAGMRRKMKSVFKEMVCISRETDISRVH